MRPVLADPAETYTINLDGVQQSENIPTVVELAAGDNNITVTVTSEDGTTTRDYTVGSIGAANCGYWAGAETFSVDRVSFDRGNLQPPRPGRQRCGIAVVQYKCRRRTVSAGDGISQGTPASVL